MTDNRTTELLHVGDILWNEPCNERMVVVAADSVCVWVRKVNKNDKLMMVGGDVWASLSRKRGIKNRCSQYYAQTMFELDGHVEQAIAATLGSGTLTAEQVRKAIERHSIETLGCRRQFREHDWQAIADELNAELGSGTCHMSFIDEYEYANGEESYLCECSECGSQTWEPAHDLPLYCRKCGRKVTR